MALPRSPWRRWRGALRFPNGGFGDFPPPRPIGSSLLVLKLPLLVPSGAGRSSRCVRLAVDVCFALPTDSPRMTGATRAAKPPKTERGGSRRRHDARARRVRQARHFASLKRGGCDRREASPKMRRKVGPLVSFRPARQFARPRTAKDNAFIAALSPCRGFGAEPHQGRGQVRSGDCL